MDRLMTLEEAAEYMRVSIDVVYKWAQQGRIPAMKAGRQWRFDKDEINQWMRENAQRAKPKPKRSPRRKKRSR